MAAGHPNTLISVVFCERGAARFHQLPPAEIELLLTDGPEATDGSGQNDAFGHQARALLEEVAGLEESASLPGNASFADGVYNMEVLEAAVESAAQHGRKVTL
ncbi:hypothetical protein [Kocuria rhizosphaericola]|uniref:hypothetical protein n=1 Tax=Kocuria rhizosphaericola TaxID=3376284 RepID=UPI00378899F6